MMRKKWILLFPVMLQFIFLQSQVPQISFETFNTSNGLSSSIITCIYQDNSGFLWIGTDFGLNKYDGNIFVTFYSEINNPNSLSGNYISDILEDADGIFWIATKDGGITRYDPNGKKEKQFMQFAHVVNDSSTIPTNRIISLFDYNSDYILAGAEVFPYIFIHKKDFSITTRLSPNLEPYFPNPISSEKNARPDWMHKMKFLDNKYFISNLYFGVVYIFDALGTPISQEQNVSGSSSVTDFILMGDTLWLASWWQGIYIKKMVYNADSNVIQIVNERLFDINDNITCLLQLQDNIILAGSRTSGLFLVNTVTRTFEKMESNIFNSFSLPSNNIHCLFRDSHDNLWVGTSSGLAKYNPKIWNFKTYPFTTKGSEVAQVFSVYAAKDRTIRICTSNGIYKKVNDTSAFEHIIFTNTNYQIIPGVIHEYANGETYLGTESNLYTYDLQNEEVTPLPQFYVVNYNGRDSVFESSGGIVQIRSMIADTIEDTSVLIMGILGSGVGILDIEKNYIYYLCKEVYYPNSIQNNMTRTIAKDRKGDIWVGTSEGLYKWHKSFPPQNNFTTYVHDPNNQVTISHNAITGVYMDEKNIVWVSTLGGGLNKLQDSVFTRYYSGLPEGNKMFGVYPDAINRLWCPVKYGFEVFDPQENIFYRIVMSSEEFTMRDNSRLSIDVNGDFLYASPSALVRLNPNDWKFESTFPKIYLRDILLFNTSVADMNSGNLSFKYNENFITFLFSALDITRSSLPSFQYRLSGITEEWLPVTSPNQLTFNSLPFGHYILELRVSNEHGQWSEPVVLSTFQLTRPFWQQWWFYALIICFAGFLIYGVIRYRDNEVHKMQSVRNKIANDLHDDIGSALSTIGLYTEVAKIKSDANNEDLQSILEKISLTSLEMQENMNHIVWSLQPRNDVFEQVVLRLKIFAAEALSAREIAVEFAIDENMHALKLTPAQRKELFLIFKEAITNIIKYAECNRVKIYFSIQKDLIVMRIQDNGIGFNENEVQAGNGMHTMRERANALKGNLRIISAPNIGTEVWLKFEV